MVSRLLHAVFAMVVALEYLVGVGAFVAPLSVVYGD